jgi:uncharacterized surface protein with fasciclin (FAS1) repeats
MKENYDIIETATKAGNFQVFSKALSHAGLREPLKDKGPYTVFAPTDDAFAKVPPGKLDDLLKPENKETLLSLLKSHVVLGKLKSNDLKSLDQTKNAQGEVLKIESRAGLWINEAKVVSADLEASNGVLHGIDTVILPQAKVAHGG